MSRQVEYVSPAGLRGDGRRPKEHRRVAITMSFAPDSDGSCRYEVGGTTILAYVTGPKGGGGGGQAMANVIDEGVITCEVGLAAFSGERRRQTQRRNRTTDQLGAAVSKVLSSVVLLKLYPNSTINVFLEVLQADGSEKSACINAAALALVDANIAMSDLPIAVTTGYLDMHPLTDLTQQEARAQGPAATVVVPGHKPENIIWLDMESRVSTEVLDALVALGLGSCRKLFEDEVLPAVKKHTVASIARRGVAGYVHQQGILH